ncbi:MAG: hypothetical protein EAZ08_10080 [Cytophagales bacterium]|nr:MAG: hypothetical protein EAZ08_10080 [Cytophagales bacterium]
MKKLNFSFAIIAFIALSVFSSCTKNDSVEPAKPLEAKIYSNLTADLVTVNPANGQTSGGTNRFTLFSFANNAIVANADSASNKWDVGFRGTTIIVNGGAIRTGQGGAFIYTGLFDELKEVPSTATFAQDNAPTSLAIPTTSGMGWYNYNPATMIITPIAGKVLVIRTGDGKFAKMEILSYYKDSPTTITLTTPQRHYTFRYIYQPNGTKVF